LQFDSQFSDLRQWTLLVPVLISWAICVCGLPVYIKLLKQFQIQQYLREEGPKSHAHKAKTPTAGGVCFWLATVIVVIGASIWSHTIYLPVMLVLAVASICGFLGLADDMAKVMQKSNKGVSEKLRLVVETLTGFVLGLFIVFGSEISGWLGGNGIHVMGFGHSRYDWLEPLGQLFISLPQGEMLSHLVPALFVVALSTFLIPATTNAVNLHDGMDGLAGGTSFLVLLTLAYILFVSGPGDLGLLCLITAGAVFGFLLFNKYPAKIFMGDTGSLFLGGLIGAVGAVGGIIVWFVPLMLIYIVETISVLAQISYFKLTKPYTPAVPISQAKLILTKLTTRLPGEGKRLFRMAPLHHHYEAVLAEKGVREWQVVAFFWLAQLSICFFVLAAFFTLRAHDLANGSIPF
jgi:phospho-N-acetylmuramoyl-pentapeptide-transferase